MVESLLDREESSEEDELLEEEDEEESDGSGSWGIAFDYSSFLEFVD